MGSTMQERGKKKFDISMMFTKEHIPFLSMNQKRDVEWILARRAKI